jgi:hypothetical protein
MESDNINEKDDQGKNLLIFMGDFPPEHINLQSITNKPENINDILKLSLSYKFIFDQVNAEKNSKIYTYDMKKIVKQIKEFEERNNLNRPSNRDQASNNENGNLNKEKTLNKDNEHSNKEKISNIEDENSNKENISNNENKLSNKGEISNNEDENSNKENISNNEDKLSHKENISNNEDENSNKEEISNNDYEPLNKKELSNNDYELSNKGEISHNLNKKYASYPQESNSKNNEKLYENDSFAFLDMIILCIISFILFSITYFILYKYSLR